MHININIHIHIHTHTHTHKHKHTHTHTHKHTHTRTHTYIGTHTHTHTHTFLVLALGPKMSRVAPGWDCSCTTISQQTNASLRKMRQTHSKQILKLTVEIIETLNLTSDSENK